MASPKVVETVGLTKVFDSLTAVQDLNLSVGANEIFGFVGPNGAGKTTVIRMITGVMTPSQGQVFLFGQPLTRQPLPIKRRVGVVGENQKVYEDVTTQEYLNFFAQLYGVDQSIAKQRIGELMERLHLSNFLRALPSTYSKGMKQKLGLVRALLHDPELLILDEPMAGLDPRGTHEVRELLLDLHRGGRTIFISSHVLSELELTATSVGIMHEGRLLFQGEVDRLRKHLADEATVLIELVDASSEILSALDRLPFVIQSSLDGHLIALTVKPVPNHREDIARAVASHGGVVLGISTRALNLEEAFLRVTSENVGLLVDRARG